MVHCRPGLSCRSPAPRGPGTSLALGVHGSPRSRRRSRVDALGSCRSAEGPRVRPAKAVFLIQGFDGFPRTGRLEFTLCVYPTFTLHSTGTDYRDRSTRVVRFFPAIAISDSSNSARFPPPAGALHPRRCSEVHPWASGERAVLLRHKHRNRKITESGKRVLTVAAPSAFAIWWLVPRLGRFAALHPDIEVRIATIDGREPDLSRDGIDVAVVKRPAKLAARNPVEMLLLHEVVSPSARRHCSMEPHRCSGPLILCNILSSNASRRRPRTSSSDGLTG
jgi:hypothetical protein